MLAGPKYRRLVYAAEGLVRIRLKLQMSQSRGHVGNRR